MDRIQSFIDQSRPSRNARLALLDFLVSDSSAGRSASGPLDLFSACRSHFEAFSTKTCCFDDMRCYVESLEQSQRKDYLEHCRQFAEKMLTGETPENVSATGIWLRPTCLRDSIGAKSSLYCGAS
jgi:N-acetyltransferase B complex (NatB) non catalytic subunit